jgi:hypothetical protein
MGTTMHCGDTTQTRQNRSISTKSNQHRNESRVKPALPAILYQISPGKIATRYCTILCLLKIFVQPLFSKAGGSVMRILVKVKNFCEEFLNKT